jgi:hypothetical protein
MVCSASKALRVILSFYTVWNLILWPLPSTLWDRLLSSSVVATVGVYLTYVHPREIVLDCPDMVVQGARLRAADVLLHLVPFASAWALTLGGLSDGQPRWPQSSPWAFWWRTWVL